MIFKKKNGEIQINLETAKITSFILNNKEMIQGEMPLFSLRFMDENGNRTIYDSADAQTVTLDADQFGAVYQGFPEDFSVHLRITNEEGLCAFRISVVNQTKKAIEWVEYPRLIFPALKENGGEGQILYPYNEGALVSDIHLRNNSDFGCYEAEYPSRGINPVFPNMCFAQFMCYLSNGAGFYFAAHDVSRTVKYIDFTEAEGGIRFIFRVFCGVNFGEDYVSDFPMVFDVFSGDWQDGADIYRNWFEKNLPNGLKKAVDTELPEWYKTLPLVVTYPVRGIHDMDKMDPNALFPYTNALPYLQEIEEKTKAKLMVILMHWEGTAPWAPPYVWPPYGGEKVLKDFADALHERGHFLGAYCSGFGYTVKSNLTDYDNTKRLQEEEAEKGFCISPDGKTYDSTICQGQRKSFDLCVGSEKGREILNKAYEPLFNSCLDYIQILDQNHGGGQYFCYSRDHGHPPVPGKWMTQTMADFLARWKEMAGLRLFGCESSSSEPFLNYLRFSDNRYELNYWIGDPVPLFSYLYHEYVHNFMGNQVCCGLNYKEDTMCYRMAYSFLAGDAMTLVMTPFGTLMPNWGCHDFGYSPDKERALKFAANMQKLLDGESSDFLMKGKMTKPLPYKAEKVLFHAADGRDYPVDAVLTSAWTYQGKTIQLFANHTEEDQIILVSGQKIVVSALSGYTLFP